MYILTYKNMKLLKSKKLENIGFIEHAFSTRDFGNLGLHVGDKKEVVIDNRRVFTKSINIDFNKLVSAEQVHGNNVVRVILKDIGKGSIDYEKSLENCDALITNVPKLPLFAFYADCVPIYIVDPIKKCIGIIHSGWKGTLSNIAGNVIDAFIKEFDSNPSNLIAVIGPYICKDCYEVNDNIIRQFKNVGYDNNQEISGQQIDLGMIIENQLFSKGLKNIERESHCTSCNLNLFFSHRKEDGVTGRMAGIIMIKGE